MWRFKCTRTLNSVNMYTCLCVFLFLAVSYPFNPQQHFLKVDWHTNLKLMLVCASNHLCVPGCTNQSGFCLHHFSPRQVCLTHLTWCQPLPAYPLPVNAIHPCWQSLFRPKSFSLSHYYSSPRCCKRLIAQTRAPLKCHFWIISFFLGCLRYSMCRFHLQMSWLLLPDAPTDWSLSTVIPLKAALKLTHAWLCPSLLPHCWHLWDLQKTMGSLQISVCLFLFCCH